MTSFRDVITISSPKNVTKITSRFFPNMGSLQSKFLVTPVISHLRIFLKVMLKGIAETLLNEFIPNLSK